MTDHQPIATIDMPASGHWVTTQLTSLVSRQLISDVGLSKSIKRVFTWADSGAGVLATVPAGSLVFWPIILVTQAFDGTTPSIAVGDAGDPDRLVQVADFNLAATGHTYADRAAYFATETELTYTLTTGGSTLGQAVLVLPQY